MKAIIGAKNSQGVSRCRYACRRGSSDGYCDIDNMGTRMIISWQSRLNKCIGRKNPRDDTVAVMRIRAAKR